MEIVSQDKVHFGIVGGIDITLGIYPILSVLPDKFARFLFEFHAFRFEASTSCCCPQTAATLMCMGPLKMIRFIGITVRT